MPARPCRSTTRREADRARGRDWRVELQLENDRRAALDLEPLGSLEDLDEEDLPDVLLDQAAGIATDMAEMQQVQPAPAQTAQHRG